MEPGVSAIVPSNRSMIRCPLPSTGSLRSVPLTLRYFESAPTSQHPSAALCSSLAYAYRRALAISYPNLGLTQLRSGKLVEAKATFSKALQAQDVLLASAPTDAQTLSNQGNVWNSVGSLFDAQQQLANATRAYQRAIDFQKRALESAPDNTTIRNMLSGEYHHYTANQL